MKTITIQTVLFFSALTLVPPLACAANLKNAKDCNVEWSEREGELARSLKRSFVNACWKSEVGTPTPLSISAEPMHIEAAAAPKRPAASTQERFHNEADAQKVCQKQLVVWLNTRSKMVHLPATHFYGATQEGAYMCASDALQAGGWRPNVEAAALPQKPRHRHKRCHC